jgi:hypothetical protein
MLSLHDIFDKIKNKFQELECEWTGQMEEYTKKNSPPKKVFFHGRWYIHDRRAHSGKVYLHDRCANRQRMGMGYIHNGRVNYISELYLLQGVGAPGARLTKIGKNMILLA